MTVLNEDRRVTEWVPDPGQFSSRLAVLRHAMGWNMKEAAIACRIAPQSWREWEDAMRLPRNYTEACRKIADRTDCDLVWLMTGYVKPGTPLLLPRMDSNHQPPDSTHGLLPPGKPSNVDLDLAS